MLSGPSSLNSLKSQNLLQMNKILQGLSNRLCGYLNWIFAFTSPVIENSFSLEYTKFVEVHFIVTHHLPDTGNNLTSQVYFTLGPFIFTSPFLYILVHSCHHAPMRPTPRLLGDIVGSPAPLSDQEGCPSCRLGIKWDHHVLRGTFIFFTNGLNLVIVRIQ